MAAFQERTNSDKLDVTELLDGLPTDPQLARDATNSTTIVGTMRDNLNWLRLLRYARRDLAV
jgi:hypothetical protein